MTETIREFSPEELTFLQTYEEMVTDPTKAKVPANKFARCIIFSAQQMTSSYFEDEEQWTLMFPIIRDAIFTGVAVGWELGKGNG